MDTSLSPQGILEFRINEARYFVPQLDPELWIRSHSKVLIEGNLMTHDVGIEPIFGVGVSEVVPVKSHSLHSNSCTAGSFGALI